MARYKLLNGDLVQMTGPELHRFSWIPDEQIGELPKVWNWLADEDGANRDAKILHWTAGVPAFPAHKHSPHAADFFRQLEIGRASCRERV
jgi:hypothetical protein